MHVNVNFQTKSAVFKPETHMKEVIIIVSYIAIYALV